MDSWEISSDAKLELLKEIRHRLGAHQIKVQAAVEVTCFTYEGIEAIVPALLAGEKSSEGQIKVTIIPSSHSYLHSRSA